MYVLIDMEWVTNRHGNHWPTQLAAIRVDEEWQTVDSFLCTLSAQGYHLPEVGSHGLLRLDS